MQLLHTLLICKAIENYLSRPLQKVQSKHTVCMPPINALDQEEWACDSMTEGRHQYETFTLNKSENTLGSSTMSHWFLLSSMWILQHLDI